MFAGARRHGILPFRPPAPVLTSPGKGDNDRNPGARIPVQTVALAALREARPHGWRARLERRLRQTCWRFS